MAVAIVSKIRGVVKKIIFKLNFYLQDKRVLIDEACSTALEFTKLYYDCLDKKRNVTEIINI